LRAFVLAAGKGTRMMPLTASVPKALLPVAGKPFLQHTLETLKACGMKRVTILVGWGRREVERQFGDGSELGLKIDYLMQKKPLGTGHAVGCAKDHMDEAFLSINGDVLVNRETVRAMVNTYRDRGNMVVAGAPVMNPSEFGILDTRKGRLRRIVEKAKKPPGNLANTGIYLFTPEIFGWIDKTERSPRGEYEITDTLTMMAKKERVLVENFHGEWVDMGRPWDLLKVNKLFMAGLKARLEGEVQSHATIEGEVVLGKGSRVLNGSYVIGPVIIGRDTDIGPNCLIRPSTYIGSGCKVGNAVEIKNSVIMDGSKAPHHNYVGDSIIARNCNLGSGTKVANLRLDDRSIRVSLKGKLVDTGLRKLGVIMGEGVKTGINASIDPGTIIGEGCFIGPGALASGTISAGSRVF
jgi:UDP-N-acetylglucosamine diphosphorylase/glucosamine-1-phosphate N-acetyltransferase